MAEKWGPPPGELFVDRSRDPGGEIVLAALRAGNVVVMVQPPRGFGAQPVAIYHDPDLPPSHHYLAAYRWLREEFGAHAMVHVGKHGNLEWLPGKTAGMSASCAADAAIGDLPLVYPFLVNDPGEGTQAKRRVHATLVDHLVPPMARAESYGDIARLEQLLDEHAQIASMDPAKLPAVRAQIWTLIQAAKLDHDLGLDDRPHDAEFDEFVLHVDGWLCEIKDAQIRDGLHVLGQAPTGAARVSLVLAILRARQMWAGQTQALPGLREALGHVERSEGPGQHRRGGSRGPGPGRGHGGGRLGCNRRYRHRAATSSTARTTTSPGSWSSRPPRSCRGWPAPPTSWPTPCMPSTADTCRPGRAVRPCAAWSTSCPPVATSTRSTRGPSRPGWPGRPARPWPTRCSSATAPTPAAIPSRSGCRSGAPRPCAPRATTSPRSSPCSACVRSGTRPRAGSVPWT